jgi:DNA repair exonuclease SbcCD ATPase subunit
MPLIFFKPLRSRIGSYFKTLIKGKGETEVIQKEELEKEKIKELEKKLEKFKEFLIKLEEEKRKGTITDKIYNALKAEYESEIQRLTEEVEARRRTFK